MTAAPAIPLFGDAYLADTRHLSLEEHGAYLQLLMIAWRALDCSLPDDDARLSRMLGITGRKWSKIKPTVMGFWTVKNGRWTQKRLSKERQWVAKKSEQNRDAINSRWKANRLKNNDEGDTNVIPDAYRNDTPPPPPLSSEPKGSSDRTSEPNGSSVGRGGYFFAGRVIRLNEEDFNSWRQTYHAIPDLRAELAGLDAWFSGRDATTQKGWWHSAPGMLSRKHQELIRARQPEVVGAWRNGPLTL
jgi:uncharacterized protein YdaU (DUF1376 family)